MNTICKSSIRTVSVLLFLFLLASHETTVYGISSEWNNDPHTPSELNSSTGFYLVTPILLRTGPSSQAFHEKKRTFFERPESRFLSSLILPGSGQFANRNSVRGGIYLAIEVLSIYFIIDYQNRGRRGERAYERFADQHWSVIQYAKWLIDYHDYHMIDNPYLNLLREQLAGVSPTFDTNVEWNQISLGLLRNVERNTPYFTTDELFASLFSHTLPDFGTQQYYELISKYYQYQAGWRDYNTFHDGMGHTGIHFGERFRIDRNGGYASTLFFEGANRSYLFNNNFRKSNRFISLLIANHFISAFDAYFTLSLKQNSLTFTPSLYPGENLRFRYRF